MHGQTANLRLKLHEFCGADKNEGFGGGLRRCANLVDAALEAKVGDSYREKRPSPALSCGRGFALAFSLSRSCLATCPTGSPLRGTIPTSTQWEVPCLELFTCLPLSYSLCFPPPTLNRSPARSSARPAIWNPYG